MNKFLLLGTILFSINHIYAQTCIPVEHNLNRQSQIDSFSIKNPGCFEIEGDLSLSGSNISNLNGLSHIKRINGTLSLLATNIVTLSSLTSLEHIGGISLEFNSKLQDVNCLSQIDSLRSFEADSNPMLADLSGFSNLKSVGVIQLKDMPVQSLSFFPPHLDYFYIKLFHLPQLINLAGLPDPLICDPFQSVSLQKNPALISLQGLHIDSLRLLELIDNDALPSLSGIEGIKQIRQLTIINNDNLTSLCVFSQLASLGDLSVKFNPKLTNLNGLNGITAMGNLALNRNVTLKDITGLQSVRTLNSVYIEDMPLNDLTGLSSVDTVHESIILLDNKELINLEGLENLKFIGSSGFQISGNTNLETLENLSALNVIKGGVTISYNENLLSLNGLDSVRSVQFLSISLNNHLPSLEGLTSLEKIKGDLTVNNNADLQFLHGLENLDSIGGLCAFKYLPNLIDASAISGLRDVGSDFILQGNKLLDSLGIFEYLRQIRGDLIISDNAHLKSIRAFRRTSEIAGTLMISGNPQLTSLAGLENIYSFSVWNLVIHDNSSLVICQNPLLCQYFTEGKPTYISNNAPACNSDEEVQSQCGTLATHDLMKSLINCSPNPTSGMIYLDAGSNKIENIKIINSDGRCCDIWQNSFDQIDLSSVPIGAYFLFIQIKGELITKMIIKN